MDYMKSKSIWYYIEILNHGLQVNQVEPDGIIKIKIKYSMNSDHIKQIVNIYMNAGWEKVNVTITSKDDSLYGTTEFEFVPPTKSTELLIKKINK